MRPEERLRSALVAAALEAYEEAGVRGLCAEGAWEVAISAMRKLELDREGPGWTGAPGPCLDTVALVVRDYDEAIEYFTRTLGFVLIEDTELGGGKRWVVIAPPGGRVFLFLHTDDFVREYAALRARGVRFLEEPRHEPYGTVAVFADLYGNRWDLLQPASAVAT